MRKLLCWLGFHKTRFYDPKTHEPVSWVVVGHEYYEACNHCGRGTGTFTLTRDMLP